MAQTIEDVESRTLLQQFHSLYKKQDSIETNVENVDAKVEQEKSDRQTADESLRNDMNTNTNKIEYNTTQITALQTGKQDKLTAGTNITIDANNVIRASGLTKVVATDVDSESATNGQVLTADGSGGASWQNASGKQQYEHFVRVAFQNTKINCCFRIINFRATAMTLFIHFSSWLIEKGFNTDNSTLSISTVVYFDAAENRLYVFDRFGWVKGSGTLIGKYINMTDGSETTTTLASSVTYTEDTVVAL